MIDAIEPVFLETDGWERVYVDLPGHGRSSGAGINSQDDVVASITEFARTFERPISLIGESRGSLIAHAIAQVSDIPLSGVCLIVPGGDDPDSIKPLHQTLVPDSEIAKGLDPAVLQRFKRLVVQNAEIAEKIAQNKIPAAAMADAETASRISENFHPTLPTAPGTVPCPSLIISGRQDAIAGWSDAISLSRQYPRATFAVLDESGHSLSWERPEVFTALVRDWLARMSGNNS